MVDAGQRVERPWAFRTNTGPGGASWAGTMQPSCRTDSRPSRLSRTSTAAPAMPGRSGPGSNWRVCSWNLTVLSLATLLLCLKHRICSRHNSGSRGRNAGSGYGGGTPKRRLNRGRNCFSTLLASPMLLAPASRSSVTSRSWKVPAARSTRPFPWGDRAKIIWIPSSSMPRLNWVGIPGRPEPGVCLKTPCRSVYRATGLPQRSIRDCTAGSNCGRLPAHRRGRRPPCRWHRPPRSAA